jgi:hypothetical protein
MERVLLVGIFICVVGAVYTGLSIDEYDSVAPVAAFSVVSLVLIALALFRVFGRRGGRQQ